MAHALAGDDEVANQTPFRDADAIWAERRRAARVALERELGDAQRVLAIGARRVGRIGAGVVLTVGLVAIYAAAWIGVLSSLVRFGPVALAALVACWLGLSLLARCALPRWWLRRETERLARAGRDSDDPLADIERLATLTPRQNALDAAERWEHASLRWWWRAALLPVPIASGILVLLIAPGRVDDLADVVDAVRWMPGVFGFVYLFYVLANAERVAVEVTWGLPQGKPPTFMAGSVLTAIMPTAPVVLIALSLMNGGRVAVAAALLALHAALIALGTLVARNVLWARARGELAILRAVN